MYNHQGDKIDQPTSSSILPTNGTQQGSCSRNDFDCPNNSRTWEAMLTSLPKPPFKATHKRGQLASSAEDDKQARTSSSLHSPKISAKDATSMNLSRNDDYRGMMATHYDMTEVNDAMEPLHEPTRVLIRDDGIMSKTCAPQKIDDTTSHGIRIDSTVMPTKMPTGRTNATSNTNTYLHHLTIGDAPLPQDMTIHQHSDPTIHQKISELQTHDFAFVLRSDRQSWTYAIIADRQVDCMVFVMDTHGSVKVLSRRRWMDHVRLVNTTKRSGAVEHDGSDGTVEELPCRVTTKDQVCSPASVSRLASIIPKSGSTRSHVVLEGRLPPPPFGNNDDSDTTPIDGQGRGNPSIDDAWPLLDECQRSVASTDILSLFD